MSAYSEFQKSIDKQQQEEADRIEEEKYEEDIAWAEQMEQQLAKPEHTVSPDPALQKENMEWMEKIIQEEKKKHGEDFGEDISFNMEDE